MTASDELSGRKARLDSRRALLLQRLQGQKADDQTVNAIVPQELEGPVPLSYTQQRVWFLQQLFPANRAYNMSEAWRIRGSLNVDALRHALKEVIRRHASLRTRFLTVDNQPMQFVEPEVDLQLTVTDLSHLSPVAREELLNQMVLAGANHAFDLSQAPLVRPSLIRLNSEDHVFQLVLHHIITDEWSNDIIWRELNLFYARAAGYEADNPPETTIQYTDYALWQREQVDAGKLDSQMDYWRKQLGGDLPLLQLPVDRPRGSDQSLRGGLVRRTLPPDLLLGIKELGQRTGTSLYMTLLAAYQALLYRYSSQEDILVGTPIANRRRTETTGAAGMFINTAVIRSFIQPRMNFTELLKQVQQTILDALANQDLPFDLLVQAMHPDRDLSYNPLFQSMFVLLADSVPRSLPGLKFERILVDQGVSKFDLTLFAGEADGRLYTSIEYSSDLFDMPTIERMLDHWQNLLRAVVDDPGQPLASLPLLGSYERDLLLKTWNKTETSLAESRCIHELIGAQAAQKPQSIAVITDRERLTYAELDARANQLARTLLQYDLQPGTPVGLFVERSAQMIVGILGILKAGAAYVPLAPEYPQERIAFALADTQTPVVVSQSHLLDKLPQTEAQIVTIEDDLSIDFGWPGASPETAVSLDDLAYVIYTSGSTGTPKGVMVTHRNLLNSTAARKLYYEKPVDRFLLLSSFAFDSSIAGIFWTLATGGALVLPAPEDEKDVAGLTSLITREQVSHTLALPTLYRLLLTYARGEQLQPLQVVIVAGEACPPDLGELHYDHLPNCSLYNEYGPTEATVWCSVYLVPRIIDSSTVPIGHPIPNSRLYILDPFRQPVPIGVPGELYVGGAGVTPGYWHNPELTAQRFPTLDGEDNLEIGRLYRTGDLARWLANGQIEFLGRVDSQVKIRGFRIEPGEIEARLVHHPLVQEAAVIVVENGSETGAAKSLAAYLALAEDDTEAAEESSTELRSYLSELLPEYLVPAHFVILPKLPRTPNGKLDPRRLPMPQIDIERPLVPPRTLAEVKLARIWKEVLNLPEVSIEDKFFALGGDSIMSIQVIARARQDGLVLTPRQMFEEQTISRLAAVARPLDMAAQAPVEVRGPVPLTPIQHWFFQQSLADPAHWNQAAWFKAVTSINREHLEEALLQVVENHPLLRARFQTAGRTWQQEIVEDAAPPEVTLLSLADLDRQAQDAAMLAAANSLHARLNLANGPLLRSALFDLGPARSPRLLIIIHHLVVDAVSWPIISSDLVTAYQQINAGHPGAMSLPSASYSQWAHALTKLARTGELHREVAYWTNQVSESAALPRDIESGGPNTEGCSSRLSVTLAADGTQKLLREVHEAYHTRIDDILLTALLRVFKKWTAADTILLTLERHGREDLVPNLDVSNTVGWFTALFPMAFKLSGLDDPGTSIRTIKEQLRGVPRNGAGFNVLRYLADEDIQQKLAALPQPEVLFNYLGQAGRQTQSDVPLQPLAAPAGQMYGIQNERVHLLDINAQIVDLQLNVNWQYATAYFQEATIAEVANSYIAELSLLIDHCLQVDQGRHTPSDFPLAALEQEDLDSLSDLLDNLD